MKPRTDSIRPAVVRAAAAVLGIWTLAVASAVADDPELLWSWSFDPPSPVNNDVATVLGGPDIDGDGVADALAACEDYTVRALSGRPDGTGTPALLWSFGGTDERPPDDRTLALFPDRSGDGLPEVLFATGANDRSVHLIRSSDGAGLWSFDVRDSGCPDLATVYQPRPVGDLDGDGVSDAAAAVGYPCRKVLALSGQTGALLWEQAAFDGFWAVAAAGDLTGDGRPDVLAGCGSNNDDNRAFLLDGRVDPGGDPRAVWEFTAGAMASTVTPIDDITGDGVADAVFGSWDGYVRALDGASAGAIGAPLWEHEITQAIFDDVTYTLRMPDVDGDCVDDVAIGSYVRSIRVLSGATGQPLWAPVSLGEPGMQVATIAITPDLDGDQQWDLIAGTWNDGTVNVVGGATGEVLWTWAAPDNVASVAAIDDLDGDGLPDVLAGVMDVSTIYALRGRTSTSCVRPVVEVEDLRVERLDTVRLRLTWQPVTDPCHREYRVYGVPADAGGCFARLVDLSDQDEDNRATDTDWTGPGEQLGYLVISVARRGGAGPLGHFRR